MKKRIYISFILLIVFGFIGVALSSAIIHEQIHKFDFRNVEKESDYICYLGTNLFGTYRLDYPIEQKEEVDRIASTTELKAHIPVVIFCFLYIFSIFTLWNYIKKVPKKT